MNYYEFGKFITNNYILYRSAFERKNLKVDSPPDSSVEIFFFFGIGSKRLVVMGNL